MRKRYIVLIFIGIVAITAAAWTRYKVVNSPNFQLAQALKDPRVTKLGAEVDALQQAVASNPKDVKARKSLAQVYAKLGLIDLAGEQFAEIVKLEPDNEDMAIGLGNSQIAQLKMADAQQTFKMATEKWPRNSVAWQGLATVMFHRHHYLEAIQYIREAIKLDPKNDDYRFILATSLIQFGQQFPQPDAYAPFFAEANKELEAILPTWPIPGEIHRRLAQCSAAVGKRQEAINHYKEAARLLNNRSDVVIDLVSQLMATGQKADAQKIIDAAILQSPETSAYHDLKGQLLMRESGNTTAVAAVAEFQQASKLDPKNPFYLERLGNALVRANDIEGAKAAFESSVQMNPERAYGYQQLAFVYTRLKDKQRAKAAAEMAVRMVYNDQQLRHIEQLSAAYPLEVKPHIRLADRYYELKMYSAARDKYLLALKIDPKNDAALKGLAKLDAEEKQAESKPAPAPK